MRINKKYIHSSAIRRDYDKKEYVRVDFERFNFLLAIVFLISLAVWGAYLGFHTGARNDLRHQQTCARLAKGSQWYLHNVPAGTESITTCTIINPPKDYQL